MTPNPKQAPSEKETQANEIDPVTQRYANLVAAARATLTAAHDGEPMALLYLADELDTYGQLPPIGVEIPLLTGRQLAIWIDWRERR